MIEEYRHATKVSQASEDCLKAFLKDVSTDVKAFLNNWAVSNNIPEAERDGFIRRSRKQLATAVALSQLADMASYMPSGPDSEEYSRKRRHSLHSVVTGTFNSGRRCPHCGNSPRRPQPDDENDDK